MAERTTIPALACVGSVPRADAVGLRRIEVDDAAARLLVTFLAPVYWAVNAPLLDPSAYAISGPLGLPIPRVTGVRREGPQPLGAEPANQQVRLQLDRTGGHGLYTLSMVGPGVDQFANRRSFRFNLDEEQPFDCRPAAPPSVVQDEAITIDYLVKDYASFRQALLDFIPTRMPAWTERSEADIGIMLLELFAASADELSYLQDRVANEAYLSTARQRRSIADHLALFDYQLDNGSAAHTWLKFTLTAGEPVTLSAGAQVSNQPAARAVAVTPF